MPVRQSAQSANPRSANRVVPAPRLLADEFTRAFQRTQWGVNGRVEPKFFDDNFVFRHLGWSFFPAERHCASAGMFGL